MEAILHDPLAGSLGAGPPWAKGARWPSSAIIEGRAQQCLVVSGRIWASRVSVLP